MTASTESSPLGSDIKFWVIIALLVIVTVFLGIDRFFPKNTVDKQTVAQSEMLVQKMKELGESISATTAAQNRINTQLETLLSRRGNDRESFYKDMYNKYASDPAFGLQQNQQSGSGEHKASGAGADDAAK